MKFKEMNLPNKLTTIRMFCVPIVITFFILFGLNVDVAFSANLSLMQILIAIFFTFASITDFVDGHLARKHNIVSDYGKLMDPLADKLLVNTTLICMLAFDFFTLGNEIMAIIAITLTILTIARDIFVDALRMQALKKGAVVPAMIWGKLKTATLMPGIVVLVFGSLHPIIFYLGLILVSLGGIFAIISGIMYFKALSKYFAD